MVEWTGNAKLMLLQGGDVDDTGSARYCEGSVVLASRFVNATVTDYPMSTEMQRRIVFDTTDLASLDMAFVAPGDLGHVSAAVIKLCTMEQPVPEEPEVPEPEASVEFVDAEHDAPSRLIIGHVHDVEFTHQHPDENGVGEHRITVELAVAEAHNDVKTPWGTQKAGTYTALHH